MGLAVIQRTKSPPPGPDPDAAPPPPSVCYATSAGPGGNVTGWTRDRSAAREFGGEEAWAVLAYYAGRANAGRVEALPARPEPEPEPAQAAEPEPGPVPEITLELASEPAPVPEPTPEPRQQRKPERKKGR